MFNVTQQLVERSTMTSLGPTKTTTTAFGLDDIELGEHELMRLGNVIVPNASYGEIIRRWSCCA